MTFKNDPKLIHCPALTTARILSGKWKTRVLWLLRERPYHFGELRRTLRGVSAKVLANQLQELEFDNLILRTEEVRNGVVHASYDYSSYGRTLIPVLDAMGNWGLAHEEQADIMPLTK